jgi:tRNA threonylcarbamoyladenosine biosynthesis protein TsaE
MARFAWSIEGAEAMQGLGAAFGARLRGGEVFRLDGPLGSGKTQWVKGLGQGLGVKTVVNSPTFTILKPHCGRLTLNHVDLYRLASEAECEDLGLEDLVDADSVMAIEWAERWTGPDAGHIVHLGFHLGHAENLRTLTLVCHDEEMEDWLSEAADSVNLAGVKAK